jgi:hypothetical protein
VPRLPLCSADLPSVEALASQSSFFENLRQARISSCAIQYFHYQHQLTTQQWHLLHADVAAVIEAAEAVAVVVVVADSATEAVVAEDSVVAAVVVEVGIWLP